MVSAAEKNNAVAHDTFDAAMRPPSLAIDDAHPTLTIAEAEEEEKQLLRKIDRRLVPCVWLMYLFSYLDRSNIGNAYTGGMGTDLKMDSNHYSIVLLVFFATYVTFEVPSNMLLTRVRPSIYLPTLMFLWGGLSMCFAAAKNWQTIAALRVVLGALEAGFAPGVLFLLSSWYKRGELARRYSLYYSAVAISGMFGGLIAGGLLQKLDGAHGIAAWKWLFIIEGAATCGVAVAAVFVLPDFPATTRWLSPRERAIASRRLALDSVGSAQGGDEDITHTQAAKMAFFDWRTWCFVFLYMLTTGSQTIQYFVPELVKSMGYKGFHVQYMTAPIYAVALAAILGFCFSSDLRKERAFHLATASAIAVVSFACLIGVLDHKGRYVLLCFGVAGVYAACPLVSIWVSNAIPHPSEKRAVVQAFVNGMGNSASLYGSYLFNKGDKNYNRKGFGVTMAFMLLAVVMSLVIRHLLAKYPYPEMQSVGDADSANTPDSGNGSRLNVDHDDIKNKA
ncbi:permease of the major facilitator superfamily [Moesziomyces antarcticus T-34]|uniref:Permease of the major facilitator superfamily n=1 Tax=Pseudozyma antarctica (strain T-34) TaxID=1151754 RepID=M9LZE4_PSEA3|nr:permease of the major facilitator superfamily [Moesziomyces antarcticus T-34]